MTIFRKKKLFYATSIIVLMVVYLLSFCCEYNGKYLNILETIVNDSKELREYACLDFSRFILLFREYWMYIFLCVSTSIPVVSYVNDEIKSKNVFLAESRMGKKRYIYRRAILAFVSSAVTTIVTYLVISLLLSMLYSPFESALSTESDLSIFMETGKLFVKEVWISAVYAGAVAMFGVLCAYLFSDIIFILSLEFFVAYVTVEWFLNGVWVFPILFMVALLLLIPFAWMYRSVRV